MTGCSSQTVISKTTVTVIDTVTVIPPVTTPDWAQQRAIDSVLLYLTTLTGTSGHTFYDNFDGLKSGFTWSTNQDSPTFIVTATDHNIATPGIMGIWTVDSNFDVSPEDSNAHQAEALLKSQKSMIVLHTPHIDTTQSSN
jgi:hypothetical protein